MKPMKLEYHPSSSDPKVWNLTLRSTNGQVVMQGTQGYTKSDAKRAATKLASRFQDGAVTVVEA